MESVRYMSDATRTRKPKLAVVPLPPPHLDALALLFDAERGHAIGPHGKRARLTPPQIAFLSAFGERLLWGHYDMALRLYPEDAAWPTDHYRATARVYRQVRDILHDLGWRVERVVVVRAGIGWEYDADEARKQVEA